MSYFTKVHHIQSKIERYVTVWHVITEMFIYYWITVMLNYAGDAGNAGDAGDGFIQAGGVIRLIVGAAVTVTRVV